MINGSDIKKEVMRMTKLIMLLLIFIVTLYIKNKKINKVM